ncbi:MAG: NifB/NifX family molybdenum-iron cluster-binding protein [Dehalococcoidia bacterium]|nr:NifB/NifX family molybdenum-iron cluster-binding protein [Dehalococcoidia bacterium]
MKIVISAEGAELTSNVSQRFGQSPYLLVVDTETMDFKTLENPRDTFRPGAGVRAVVFAVSEDVEAVLTGYCSPTARNQLASNGIKVITNVSGTVEEVVEKYKAGGFVQGLAIKKEEKEQVTKYINRDILVSGLRNSAKQFANILPVTVGVVLCIGLFNNFVSKEALSSIFSGNVSLDTLWGACFGSILAGNPINSYVIGAALLDNGVSLFAVTALIITWVTVGLVQLPAEIASLGLKFALLRNGLCFILAIPVAILTVMLLNFIVG